MKKSKLELNKMYNLVSGGYKTIRRCKIINDKNVKFYGWYIEFASHEVISENKLNDTIKQLNELFEPYNNIKINVKEVRSSGSKELLYNTINIILSDRTFKKNIDYKII